MSLPALPRRRKPRLWLELRLFLVALAQLLQGSPAGRAAPGLDALQQACELAVYLAVLATLAQG